MKSALVPVVRYGYVPSMLLGLNGAAYAVITGKHSYAWLAVLLLCAFGGSYFAERIAPSFEEWNHDHGDGQANIWHALAYEGGNVVGLLLIPFITWLSQLTTGGLLSVWPREWPLLAQLVMAIVIADLAFMMIHYLSHRWPTLWRLHAVHHGVSRLYGFNGLVRHPLHQTLDMVFGTAPLVILGMPLDVAILLGFAISVQLVVQHSNVDYELGPLRNVFSIGRIHHLHHVNWGKQGDCNFGLFLTLGDRLFGTFVPEPPRPIRAKDMGIDDVPNFPRSYVKQLIFPFVYRPGLGVREEPRRSSEPGGRAPRIQPAE